MKKWISVGLCLLMLISSFPVLGASSQVLGRWLFYNSPTGIIYDVSGNRQHLISGGGEKQGYGLSEQGAFAAEIAGQRGITAAAKLDRSRETNGVILEIGNESGSVFKVDMENGKLRVFVKPSQYDRIQNAEASLPDGAAEITVSVNIASGVIRIYADSDCILEKRTDKFAVNRFSEMPNGTSEKIGEGISMKELLVMAGARNPEQLERPENRAGIEMPVSMWSFDAVKDGVVEDVLGECDGFAKGYELSDEAVSGQSMLFIPGNATEVNFENGITGRLTGKTGFTVSLWIQEIVKIQRPNIFNLYMEDGLPGFQVAVGNTQIQVRIRSKNGEAVHENIYTYHGFGVWDNLTFSADFTEGYIKVYHDGKELEPSSGSSKLNCSSGTYQPGTPKYPDILGGERIDPNAPEYLTGWIDEVVLYDRAVTAKEIAALASVYGSKKSTKETERVLYNSIRKKTEKEAVMCEDKGDVLWQGEKTRLNPEDYSVVVKRGENGVYYLPEDFFSEIMNQPLSEDGTEIGEMTENGVRYVAAQAAAEKAGLQYYEKDGLLVIGEGKERFTGEEEALMRQVFTAPNYPEPSDGYKYTRSTVQYSDYTKNGISLGSPCIIELGDGTLLASYDYNGANYKVQTGRSNDVGVCISEDGGKTWTKQGQIENMIWASIFENNGALYAIGRETTTGKVGIAQSTDLGKSWSTAAESIICSDVISAHCAPTPVQKVNGRIYRAFEDSANEDGIAKWTYTKRAFIMSAAEDSDLMQASSWTMSNRVPFEREWMPEELLYGSQMGYLEGNAVAGKDGSVYDILRIEADPQSGYACALKLSPDGKTLTFDRIFELPCGKDKFTIRYDTETEKYVTIGNIKTDPNTPAQRNVVGLCVSEDLFHWEVAEILFVDDSLIPWHESIRFHGIQYPDFVIDGDDLLVVTRDALEETTYYHNANYIHFWRVRDFRRWIEGS